MTTAPYPVRVSADLDPSLNRWLWLVKWVLVVPHLLILTVLWVCFVALSVVAFFAILFTGRYPRAIFDFNVGVLRWTWRVGYYAYGALGTDHYPPFTLEEVPDYPAHLTIGYPEHLSRGLVLVKWWLLAIPHYLVLAFLVGGAYAADRTADAHWGPGAGGGLIGLLVLVAAVTLLFTGSYPRPLFDLVLGLNRWALRVAAYAALMTDAYPPFRLDMGGDEPSPGRLVVGGPEQPPPTTTTTAPTTTPTTAPATPATRWGAGRVIALVAGALALLAGGALVTTGAAVAIAGQTARDAQGYYMSPHQSLSSDGYAIVSETVRLPGSPAADWVPSSLLGRVKITARATDGRPLFIGVGAATDVARYLDGVAHSTVTAVGGTRTAPRYRDTAGTRPPQPPDAAGIWTAQVRGAGERELTWSAEPGDWTLVVMNADGSAPVAADTSIGATLPAAGRLIVAALVAGGVLLVLGLALVVAAVATRRSSGPPPAPVTPAS